MTHVLVRVGATEQALGPGDQLAFGRNSGPGQVAADHRSVSGRHGLIDVDDRGWSVTSTGSLYSFSVYDVETPSRLYIPLGAGPVQVPFAHAVIAIEILDRRYVLQVDSVGAAGWANSWRSVRDHDPRRRDPEPLDDDLNAVSTKTTRIGWSPAQFMDRKGNVRRWYQVLAAMCEPRLRVPAETREERIPTNKQLALRLGISDRTLEKHLDELRQQFGFDTYTDQMRVAAVVIAISQGIVTIADLAVLAQATHDPEPTP